MAEWTTQNGDWIDEANKDIIYPGQAPVYKYQASHFAGANRDLKAAMEAGDYAKMGQILVKTAVYLTDYDVNSPTLQGLVEQYNQYLKRYNYEVERINSQFMDIYLGFVPANPSSIKKDEGV